MLNMNTKNLFWNVLKRLSDLSISITMFLVIAFVSFTGTIIEQDKSLEYYKLNYPDDGLFVLNWKCIIFLGLNHVYSNSWFLIILTFFFLSLMLCTFSTQLPILRYARRWKFLYNSLSIEKMTYSKSCMFISIINFVYLLNLRNYYVFYRGKAIYAYKGLVGRIAPIFVHLSIVMTLSGSVVGLTTGFFAQEFIPSAELFHLQNIIKSGYFNIVPNDYLYKIDDFYVVYNRDSSIKQFFSDLSIIDQNGRIMYSGQVSVNHPIKFRGITFYQTDWNLNALRLKIGHSYIVEKSLVKTSFSKEMQSFGFCIVQLNNKHKIVIIVNDLNGYVVFYDEIGNLIIQTKCGTWNVMYGVPICVQDLMPITGLQIKSDPGVYVAYFGFLILMNSIWLSYISYSQIWANYSKNKFYFSGNTNRAYLSFENEVMKIYNKYISIMSFI